MNFSAFVLNEIKFSRKKYVICKSFKEKDKMKGRAGDVLLDRLCRLVEAGMSTLEIDGWAVN